MAISEPLADGLDPCHTFMNQALVDSLLQVIREADVLHRPAVGFCIVGFLSRLNERHFKRFVPTLYNQDFLELPGLTYIYASNINGNYLARKQILIYLNFPVFVSRLCKAIDDDHVPNIPLMYQGSEVTSVLPIPIGSDTAVPSFTRIPFHDFMVLPPPLTSDAGASFATCHIPIMTSAEFILEGEWTGFYSLGVQEGCTFDAPMCHIQFAKSKPIPSRGRLYLTARGVDSVGMFSLDGFVSQRTGEIDMHKRYDLGFAWAWSALMTPFGIVGNWGDKHHGGWLWLWKTN